MDATLFSQADMARAERTPLAGGEALVFSTRSPGKPTANEDAAAVIRVNDHAGVLLVADGLGGLPAGEEASALAIRTLVDSIRQWPEEDQTFRAAILNGIEEANRAVIELGVGAATTLAVAEIQHRSVRPYHVGDSMILLVGQRGKIKLQTVSHSPVGYAVESGLLDEQEAMLHQERHLVSNILGAADMRIEVGSSVDMAHYDTLLLASDALADNFHTAEIVERIRKGPLKRVMPSLANECLARMQNGTRNHPGKPDDLTFMAFRCRRT